MHLHLGLKAEAVGHLSWGMLASVCVSNFYVRFLHWGDSFLNVSDGVAGCTR